MVSTVEDRFLTINLQGSNRNGATRLCKIFSKKRRNVNGLKTLIKKLMTLALSTDYKLVGSHDGPTCTSVTDWQALISIFNGKSHRCKTDLQYVKFYVIDTKGYLFISSIIFYVVKISICSAALAEIFVQI